MRCHQGQDEVCQLGYSGLGAWCATIRGEGEEGVPSEQVTGAAVHMLEVILRPD